MLNARKAKSILCMGFVKRSVEMVVEYSGYCPGKNQFTQN
jgi:hypothetical protein